MIVVSFEQWLVTLRRCAERHGVELDANDARHRYFYDVGNTPYGTVMEILEFGYN